MAKDKDEMIMQKQYDLMGLGEIMLRLNSPVNERLARGGIFEKQAGGSELNVLAGASMLGLKTGMITKLPANPLGSYIRNSTRFMGVSDDYYIYDRNPDARLGVYYYEYGAAPRKPTVVYDRANSSFQHIHVSELPEDLFQKTRMFHVSGITPALCKNTRDTAMECIRNFKKQGTAISFDVNYRAALWSEEDARKTILQILPLVDVLFVSEETSRRMLQKTGELHDIMRSYCQNYGIKVVATTQRTVHSPKSHDFTSQIYCAGNNTFYEEDAYRNIDVVDRIGSGDAYVAGALYGLLRYGEPQKALEYGNAASSLKNTVPGDLPCADLEDADQIIRQHQSKAPGSELNR